MAGSIQLVSHHPETYLPLLVRVVSSCILIVIANLEAGHDSTVTIVYPGQATFSVKSPSLPYVSLCWTSEDALVAAGHDCQPVLFSGTASGWRAVGSLDDTTAPKSAGAGRASPVGRLNSAAFATFRNADMRGQSSLGMPGAGGEIELPTVHQNTITSVRAYAGSPGQVAKLSTSGVDGKLVVWNVSAASAAGLAGKLGAMRV